MSIISSEITRQSQEQIIIWGALFVIKFDMTRRELLDLKFGNRLLEKFLKFGQRNWRKIRF